MSMTDTLPSFLLHHFGHVEDVDKDGALNVPALAVHAVVDNDRHYCRQQQFEHGLEEFEHRADDTFFFIFF